MKFKPTPIPTQLLTQEQFDTEMAFAPRKYFFPTIEAFTANMNKRTGFLKTLEAVSLITGVFTMGKDFREDFLSRND